MLQLYGMSGCLPVISLFLSRIPRSTQKAVIFVTLLSNTFNNK